MPDLKQLTLQNASFDRASLKRFKERRGEVTIHAFGKAILGVSGEPTAEGFLIQTVVSGSGADQGGIAVGDVLKRIDGEPITSFEALTLVVSSHDPGDAVPVELVREGKTLSVKPVLGSR
jgi:S1-C subfamily serine protease